MRLCLRPVLTDKEFYRMIFLKDLTDKHDEQNNERRNGKS